MWRQAARGGGGDDDGRSGVHALQRAVAGHPVLAEVWLAGLADDAQ
jgi:hypothetical protein